MSEGGGRWPENDKCTRVGQVFKKWLSGELKDPAVLADQWEKFEGLL